MTIMMRARGKKELYGQIRLLSRVPASLVQHARKAMPQPARSWSSELSSRIPTPEANRAEASVPAA